jgi:cardiolipin synthase
MASRLFFVYSYAVKLEYFTTVTDTWDAVYRDCAEAEESIRFEQYMLTDFGPGSVGERFADLFIKKARVGISVRVLLDIVGSYNAFRSPYLKKMREAGVKIKFISFQFQQLRDILDWTPNRNHRKLAVIDSRIAYIGGVIFSDYAKDWDDFHVRIRGAGAMFSEAFEKIWNNEGMKTIFHATDGKHELEFSLIGNEHRNNYLYKHLKERIKNAKDSIRIVTPYFSPGVHLKKALLDAAKRGVKVYILIPSHTDILAAQLVHMSFVSLSKVKNMHFLSTKKMNHAKMIQIDDWLTFGSSNFDRLSLFYNKELNVATEDKRILKQIEEIALIPFFKKAEAYEKVYKQYYRGVVSRFFLRIVGFFLRPFV